MDTSYKTTEELCEQLQVTPATLTKLTNAGKLPVLSLGHRLRRYDVAAVQAALGELQKAPKLKGGKR